MGERIDIFGAGWLGLDVALDLHSEGNDVCVFSRSVPKIAALEDKGIAARKIDFDSGLIEIPKIERVTSTLLVCLPPSVSNYCANLQQIVLATSPKHIVFCSSIGLYAATNGGVDETGAIDSKSILYEAEQAMLRMNTPLSILRLGGLIGEDRNPATHFSNKEFLPNGLAPVNLIHKLDVISCISGILKQNPTGIFNVVHPSHPSRKEYYENKCMELGLPQCSFRSEGEGKTVGGDKIMRVLGRKYTHPI
jgi:nucleoside-diphosphate-sugar epimerase